MMDCSPDGSVGSYTSLHISPAQGTWRQRPDERSRSLFIGQRSLDWPHTKDLGKKKQNRTYSFLPNPANAPIWTTPNHVESRLRLPPVRGPVRGRAGPRFFSPKTRPGNPTMQLWSAKLDPPPPPPPPPRRLIFHYYRHVRLASRRTYRLARRCDASSYCHCVFFCVVDRAVTSTACRRSATPPHHPVEGNLLEQEKGDVFFSFLFC